MSASSFINFSTMISLLVLTVIVTIVTAYFVLDFIFRLRGVKKLNFENKYENMKWMFYIYISGFIVFPLTDIAIIVLLSLKINDYDGVSDAVGIAALIIDILFTIYLIVFIVLLLKSQNSAYVSYIQDNFIFIEAIVNKNTIIEMYHDIKRKNIFIDYDDQGITRTVKLIYNWKLKDWLSNLTKKEISVK